MPMCPICEKQISIFQWDIFGRGCTACVGIDRDQLDGLMEEPCPQCGGWELYATSAPALAVVQSKNGPIASKVAPGLFVIGCADCGCAYLQFTRKSAATLPDAAGWLGRKQLKKEDNTEVNCPTCGAALNFRTPAGIRVSDEDPRRIYCEACNEELSNLL